MKLLSTFMAYLFALYIGRDIHSLVVGIHIEWYDIPISLLCLAYWTHQYHIAWKRSMKQPLDT